MIIEKFTKNDLSLLELVAKIFDQYRMFYGRNSDLLAAKNFLQERVVNEESQIFLAKDGEKIIGFMQLYFGFSSVRMEKVCILNDLYVDQDYRKRGVARALIQRAKEFCLENKLMKITLTTAKTNEGAQKLYESEGYEVEEEFLVYNLELGLMKKK